MKWTERGKDRWTAKLGSGLNLHVYRTTDAESIRLGFDYAAEVFGIKRADSFRTAEIAREVAEDSAKSILKSACAECGLKVVEG